MSRPVLLLAVLLLAGCVAPAPGAAPPPPEEAPPAAREEAVALEGCTVVEALVHVPEEAARRHVPPAFEPVASQGLVRAVLGGFACAGGDAGGLLALPVVPRDPAIENGTAGRHFWRPEVTVQEDAPLAGAYARVGALVTIVAAVRAEVSPTGGSLVIEGEGWRHRVAFAPGPAAALTPEAVGGVFREWSGAAEGFSYLQATFLPSPSSRFGLLPATVETGAGTAAREVLGDRAQGVAFVLTDAAYAGARVGSVPAG